METNEKENTREAVQHFLTTYPDIFTEAYFVGDKIEIVANGRMFRIEPKESIHNEKNHFDVSVYEKEDNSWNEWSDFPWCDRDSKAEVIRQALSFFWDRLRSKD